MRVCVCVCSPSTSPKLVTKGVEAEDEAGSEGGKQLEKTYACIVSLDLTLGEWCAKEWSPRTSLASLMLPCRTSL